MINIIVPVYNIEQFLPRCLDSLKNQTCQNFNAILIDDGSKDNCPDILDNYTNKQNNFIVMHKKNGGLSDAIKYGIKNSPKCDYFMFLDGDDYLENNAVEVVNNEIEKKHTDIIVYDFFKNFNTKPMEIVNENITEGVYLDKKYLTLKNELIIGKNYLHPCRWNKVFNSNLVFENLNYYDTRTNMAEDLLFSTTNIFSANSLTYIKKPLIHYCENNDSLTHKYNNKYFESYKIVYSKLKQFFNDETYPNKVFFQHLKTLIQTVLMYCDKKIKKDTFNTILKDDDVKYLLANYKPQGIRDKILFTLLKHRSFLMLTLLTRINNK